MTESHYPNVNPNPDFPLIEQEILDFWQENELFRKSVESRPIQVDGKNNEFIFYDGPPFANGLPHYGHLLTGFVKDAFARYQTMQGKRVERRFGWDCHGLPAEMGSEKELGISGRQAITQYGIDKFNDYCRSSVMKYRAEWEYYVTRQARWVDFQGDYKTMDTGFMESVLWAFKQLHEKGLVYEAYRVMPYSWAAETPLSNFETRLDNSYREREDKAVTVSFKLDKAEFEKRFKNFSSKANEYYILAWTTTPWTLPSNLALAVNANLKYKLAINEKGIGYIFAESVFHELAEKLELKLPGTLIDPDPAIAALQREEMLRCTQREYPIDGNELIGLSYEPLFPYFESAKKLNAFHILDGSSFVTDTDGTGIVHMAPGFGEEDQRVCEANNIGYYYPGWEEVQQNWENIQDTWEKGVKQFVCPVDHSGHYTDEIRDIPHLSLKGLNVIADKNKNSDEPYRDEQLAKYGLANLRIVNYLKNHYPDGSNRIINENDFRHNYPHCWRTDTPLIYRAISSWYVEVTKFNHRMVELNQQINWIPGHVKDGLFGKWLENARDWSISRNRFWGTPIPIWRSDNPNNKNLYVFGSIKELEEFFNVEVKDLHRPYIDDLTKPDPEDSRYTLRRVEDVFDCWFESGSMPYGQMHYPFENKEKFEARFPADFIVEYMAQTRGWFYTLMVLSTALFDKPPFLNCICHGVVLDDKGQKLSKRLNNYADPTELFNKFGADALRWFMLASPVMRGSELYIDKEGKFIRDVVRLSIKPVWNAYNFFCLYANADGIKAELSTASTHAMDRYILSKLAHAVKTVRAALDEYRTPDACEAVGAFFETLNNWYIRRSKPRFWSEGLNADKQAAYNTLFTCLHVMLRAVAPLLPLASEEMYLGLTARGQRNPENSVHLAELPLLVESISDQALENAMDRVQDICNAALSIRASRNIRVRQPLQSLTLLAKDANLDAEFISIICDEVNVKDFRLSKDLDANATLKLQVHFPILGKRLPDKMKQIIPASKKGEWSQTSNGDLSIAGVVLEPQEFSLVLEPKPEFKDSAQALKDNSALVILDTNVTPELEQEGIARDMVRAIQQARKDAGLHVADRIELVVKAPAQVASALSAHKEYILEQTLGLSLSQEGNADFVSESVIDNEKISIGLTRAA